MFEAKVKDLLEKALEERPDLFLIKFSVSSANAINIILDGDKGVVVDDCVFISRAIEHNIDREEFDFSLEVASAGATTPLNHIRQYKKNIGRTLVLKTNANETFEAKLSQANNDEITLNWKAREPKPVGKGKVTVNKEVKVKYNDIEQAAVKLKF